MQWVAVGADLLGDVLGAHALVVAVASYLLNRRAIQSAAAVFSSRGQGGDSGEICTWE